MEKSNYILVKNMNKKFKNLIVDCLLKSLVQEYVKKNKLIKKS